MSGNVILGQPLAGTLVAERQKSRRRWQKNFAGYAFIAPWLIGFFAFTLIPVIASLVLAFTNFDNMSPPQWVGLANFQQMFTRDFRYWKSVQATFFYVFTAVPIRLIVALGIAMLLNSNRKGISFYRAAFYAPSIVGGSVAVAIMWREIFGSKGAVNAVMVLLGVPEVNWLGNPQTAIWTLITLAAWQFGSPMLIFLAGLKQIPAELYEAASIDGASGIQTIYTDHAADADSGDFLQPDHAGDHQRLGAPSASGLKKSRGVRIERVTLACDPPVSPRSEKWTGKTPFMGIGPPPWGRGRQPVSPPRSRCWCSPRAPPRRHAPRRTRWHGTPTARSRRSPCMATACSRPATSSACGTGSAARDGSALPTAPCAATLPRSDGRTWRCPTAPAGSSSPGAAAVR